MKHLEYSITSLIVTQQWCKDLASYFKVRCLYNWISYSSFPHLLIVCLMFLKHMNALTTDIICIIVAVWIVGGTAKSLSIVQSKAYTKCANDRKLGFNLFYCHEVHGQLDWTQLWCNNFLSIVTHTNIQHVKYKHCKKIHIHTRHKTDRHTHTNTNTHHHTHRKW